MKTYYVYILASFRKVLYIGITNDLYRRVQEHKSKVNKGFTSKYRVNRLVYFETYERVIDAIAREKEIKGWRREKKVALISLENEQWEDLSAQWDE